MKKFMKVSKRAKKLAATFMLIMVLALTIFALAVPAFAASGTVDIGITTEMVEPILDYVVANIAVIMPIGIAIMGIMIGIALIPRIIKRFTNA